MNIRRWFCRHWWEVLHQGTVKESKGKTTYTSYVVVQRCKKCGKVETIKTKFTE